MSRHKTNTYKKNNKVNTSSNMKVNQVNSKPKKGWILWLKFLFLAALAIGVVVYTDHINIFSPDQSNNHTQRKWDAYYKFTDKDTVDIVLVGNSHCYAGINPKNLSAALGVNCFVLASPGTTLMDSYFCLKEALTRTHPTIAIIETYGISNTENHKLTAGALSDQFKSFNARKNKGMKIASTPELFSVEHYIPAWSTTIRNHEFIFRDTAQLHKNIWLRKHPIKKDNKLYLGRFVAFSSGITDSVLHLYDSLGAPVDGAARSVNKENETYLKKIVELCEKNNVIPVFVTVPMYYKHVKDYTLWHNMLNQYIGSKGYYWLDMQEPYDTLAFNTECFENTFEENQHMTYTGSVTCAYKIAHYIHSLPISLTNRSASARWNEKFYGEEGYFENYSSRENDTTNVLICKNLNKNGIVIKDAIFQKGENNNKLMIKVKKDESSKMNTSSTLRVIAKCRYQGHIITTFLDLTIDNIFKPINHDLYNAMLLKDVEVLEIMDCQFIR